MQKSAGDPSDDGPCRGGPRRGSCSLTPKAAAWSCLSYKYVIFHRVVYMNVWIVSTPCSPVDRRTRSSIALRPSGPREYDAQTRAAGRLRPGYGWRCITASQLAQEGDPI